VLQPYDTSAGAGASASASAGCTWLGGMAGAISPRAPVLLSWRGGGAVRAAVPRCREAGEIKDCAATVIWCDGYGGWGVARERRTPVQVGGPAMQCRGRAGQGSRTDILARRTDQRLAQFADGDAR
jgi:hypothetical protein